jgi:hypothetical protein
MQEMRTTRRFARILLAMAATLGAVRAQTFTTLAVFDGPNGMRPEAGLAQGLDGNFYGTTHGNRYQGVFYPGTVFRVTPDGTLTAIASLGRSYPTAGLLLATNGYFYGTTTSGGHDHAGTLFEIGMSGGINTLFSACADRPCKRLGAQP